MALLSFENSTPRAQRLKAGNACPLSSTSIGTFPLRSGRLVGRDGSGPIHHDNAVAGGAQRAKISSTVTTSAKRKRIV